MLLGITGLKPRRIRVRRCGDGKYVDGLWRTSNAIITEHLAIVTIGESFSSRLSFGDVESFSERLKIFISDGFVLRVAHRRDVADIVSVGDDEYKVVMVDARPHHRYCKAVAERLPENAGFFDRNSTR
jgi:hypothetical protein